MYSLKYWIQIYQSSILINRLGNQKKVNVEYKQKNYLLKFQLYTDKGLIVYIMEVPVV